MNMLSIAEELADHYRTLANVQNELLLTRRSIENIENHISANVDLSGCKNDTQRRIALQAAYDSSTRLTDLYKHRDSLMTQENEIRAIINGLEVKFDALKYDVRSQLANAALQGRAPTRTSVERTTEAAVSLAQDILDLYGPEIP